MFNIFGKTESKTKPKTEPKIGEEHWAIHNDSPWKKENTTYIKILDVKNGWVRYSINRIFNDERMEMEIFLKCYENYEDKDYV